MKLIYKILFLYFFLFNHSYPQFYAEDVISPFVIEFMKIADEFAKSFDQEQGIYKIEFLARRPKLGLSLGTLPILKYETTNANSTAIIAKLK